MALPTVARIDELVCSPAAAVVKPNSLFYFLLQRDSSLTVSTPTGSSIQKRCSIVLNTALVTWLQQQDQEGFGKMAAVSTSPMPEESHNILF